MVVINGTKLYNSDEIQAILNIGNAAYINLRKKGLLRTIRLSGRLYTSEEALQAYLKGETLPPPPPLTGQR